MGKIIFLPLPDVPVMSDGKESKRESERWGRCKSTGLSVIVQEGGNTHGQRSLG